MREFLDAMQKERLTSLAIVGLAKNVGKTTTLGAVLDEAARRGMRVGITSIGRDGEPVDLITGEKKPRIRLVPGSLVATSFTRPAPVQVVERTGIRTALGEIDIARVTETCDLEVAGPATRDDLAKVVPRLAALGAELVLVDGAIDRRASACPLVTDATVLAAGMSLSPMLDEVVREARHVVRMLTLPKRGARPKAPVREVKGALTETALAKLVEERFAGTVVVADPTRVFVEPMTLAKFEGTIVVERPVRLLGVTVSPYEPGGRGADPGTLLGEMRAALKPVPVFDVVFEVAPTSGLAAVDGGGGPRA